MGPKRKQANAAIKSPAKKKRVERAESAEDTPKPVTESETKDFETSAAKLKVYEPPVPMEPFSFSLSCFSVAVAHSSYVAFPFAQLLLFLQGIARHTSSLSQTAK